MKYLLLLSFFMFSTSLLAFEVEYKVYHPVVYSTSVGKGIQQVVSLDEKLMNFIECDLVRDEDGKLEGHSTKNCTLLSPNWVLRNHFSSTRFVNFFNQYANEKLQEDQMDRYKKLFIYLPGIVIFTGSIKLFSYLKSRSSNQIIQSILRGGNLVFAIFGVGMLYGTIKAILYEPASIDSILENKTSHLENFELNDTDISTMYTIIRESCLESFRNVGFPLLI